jgi:hypothetical protein
VVALLQGAEEVEVEVLLEAEIAEVPLLLVSLDSGVVLGQEEQ